jgi:hypothetical protein
MRLAIATALQIVAFVSFLIWVFTAMFVPMLFAGGDGVNTRIVSGLFIAMPILMIVASSAIWVGYFKSQAQIMVIASVCIALSYLPLLWT